MLLAINQINGISSINKINTKKSYQNSKLIKTNQNDVFEKSNPAFKSFRYSNILEGVSTPNYLHISHVTAAKGALDKNLNSWKKELYKLIDIGFLSTLSRRSSINSMIENLEVLQPILRNYQNKERTANILRKSSGSISSAEHRLIKDDYVEKTPIAALNDLLTIGGIRGFELKWDYTKNDYETARNLLDDLKLKDYKYSDTINKALFKLDEFWSVPNYKLNRWVVDNIDAWESDINWD